MPPPTFLMGVGLTLVILWAVYTSMPPPLNLAMSILVIIMLIVALLSIFGLLDFLSPLHRSRPMI